jgi:light-regulated signal transduction histidine kinase (bacteriophytochrome)
LGFIILEVEPKYVQVCNALRALLSGALQGVLLLEQRRRTEVKLLESENELKSTVANLKFANQELESFAYSISHDLRAPLRAIVGFSAIIEREYHHLLDEEAQRLFARIAEKGKRMGMLIDGLLSFSRMGRQQFNIQTVDMHTMVQEVCRELTENMPNRKIVWALHDIPPAQADPQLIKQVWINLVSNAIKYTARRETAQIEIGWLLLENIPTYFIRDNGAGFDMAYADKLFGVFNRLHHEDEFEGTGIGLALSKRIVTRQGGNIWAESKVDEGATFYFTLGRS